MFSRSVRSLALHIIAERRKRRGWILSSPVLEDDMDNGFAQRVRGVGK